MPSLTVDVEDRTQAGFDSIEAAIDHLIGSQQKQVDASRQQRNAFADVTVAGINAYKDIQVATLKYTAETTQEVIKSTASVLKYVTVGTSAVMGLKAVWGKHTEKVKESKVVVEELEVRQSSLIDRSAKMMAMLATTQIASDAVRAAGFKKTALLVELAADQAEKKVTGFDVVTRTAAQSFVKAWTGMGPVLLGASITLGAMEMVWARTGKRMDVTDEAAKRIAKSLAMTDDEVNKLTNSTEKFQVAMDRFNAARGFNLAEDMGEAKTNLDRLDDAFGKVTANMTRDIKEVGTAIADWWNQPFQLPESLQTAWDSFDKSTTESVDTMIKNIGHVNTAYRSTMDWYRTLAVVAEQYYTGAKVESIDMYREELKGLREMQDETAKLEAARKRSRDSFEILGRMNKDLQAKIDERAEAQRIASIKSVAAINAEIEAMKMKGKQLADKGAFDVRELGKDATDAEKEKNEKAKQAQQEYMQARETLEKRKLDIIKEVADAEKKAAEQSKKLLAENTKARQEHVDALISEAAAHNKLYDAEKQRQREQSRLNQDVGGHLQANAQKYALDIEREKLNIMKDQRSEAMKAGGATDSQVKTANYQTEAEFSKKQHALKIQQIDDEAKLRINRIREEIEANEKSSLDDKEKLRNRIKLMGDEDKAVADFRKKRADEEVQFRTKQKTAELQQVAQLEAEKFRLWKEGQDKKKAAQQGALSSGFDAKEFMQSADPERVFRQVQENRARRAAAAQANEDRDLKQAADSGDRGAAAEYARNQRTAMARARRSAYSDMEAGKLGEGEISKAQASLAQETIGTFKQQGALNAEQAKFMIEATQTAALNSVAIANMQQQVAGLTAAMKGQKAGAQQAANKTADALRQQNW